VNLSERDKDEFMYIEIESLVVNFHYTILPISIPHTWRYSLMNQGLSHTGSTSRRDEDRML
jgi:hypothetical protein